MNRRKTLKNLAAALPALLMARRLNAAGPESRLLEPMAQGPFTPDWQSLEKYEAPAWFGDAKFGIWAHWGAQCQPGYGDWYARNMYLQGNSQYNYHVQKYGHPSRFGFKDVIHEWKAEHWDPDELMALYKRAGAQYFCALANHCDNFDNFNSKHHPWNATRIGPRKDVIGGWARAARKQGLRFGVSVHAAHAWTWYETAQGADRDGPLAGVPYDGRLRREDGKGAWWDGLDPQALYAQRHALSLGSDDPHLVARQWDWGAGASLPDQQYCDNFYNRTVDLINQYDPDLLYFDDSVLPLWPVSDVGLRLAAHMYNRSIQRKGKLDFVLSGKILDEQQRKCMVLDIERGHSKRIEPRVWQTDTCLGGWHYDRRVFEEHRYKSTQTVIHTLADVVSKNGNLLLSVPMRGDGTIDSDERAVVEGIAAWMKPNGESIFGTRPWHVFGEGPAQEEAAFGAQVFHENKGRPFGPQDIRFTTKGRVLYAIALGWPANGKLLIKSLSAGNALRPQPVSQVALCGGGPLVFERKAEGLEVTLPQDKPEAHYAYALRIT